MKLPDIMPKAWLGYSPRFDKPKPTIRICAWCRDKNEAEKLAKDNGCDCTHDICAHCYAGMIAALTGEEPEHYPNKCEIEN